MVEKLEVCDYDFCTIEKQRGEGRNITEGETQVAVNMSAVINDAVAVQF